MTSSFTGLTEVFGDHVQNGGIRFYGASGGLEPDAVTASIRATETAAVVGKRFDELPPGRFGIHETITIDGADGLTPYIERDFDGRLREHVRRIRTSSSVELLTLVGESCTGKSRAALEALKAELGDWQIFIPVSRRELLSALKTGIPSRTAVLLDDLDGFIGGGPDGLAAATGILRLQTAGGVGPILFLSTVWPEVLSRLSSRKDPDTASDDDNSVRRLLIGDCAHRVFVPDGFDESLIDPLQNGPDTESRFDPRIWTALTQSDQIISNGVPARHVVQFLTGASTLVHRFEGDSYAVARFSQAEHLVLRTALELIRAGLPPALPVWLLERTVTHSISQHFAKAPPQTGWFERTIGLLTSSREEWDAFEGSGLRRDYHIRGVPAMTYVQNERSRATAVTVHDYLIQHYQRRRSADPIDEAVRASISDPAIVKKLSDRELGELAWESFARGDSELANLLAESLRSPLRKVVVLERLGEYVRAADELADRSEFSVNFAVRRSGLLCRAGQQDKALEVLRPHRGKVDPALLSSDLLLDRGDIEEAIVVLSPLAATNVHCALKLAMAHNENGNPDLAEAALRPWSKIADTAIPLAKLLAARGEIEQALSILETADVGHTTVEFAQTLLSIGGPEAEQRAVSALTAVSKTDSHAAIVLAGHYVERGDIVSAIDLLTPTSKRNRQSAVHRAMLLAASGDEARAFADLENWVDVSPEASLRLSELLCARDEAERAIEILAEPARHFPQSAVRRAELLRAAGREADAFIQLRRHSATSQEASLRLADWLVERGDRAGAVQMLRAPAQVMYISALRLAHLLRDQAELEEAKAVLGPHTAHHHVRIALAVIHAMEDRLDLATVLLRRPRLKAFDVVQTATYLQEMRLRQPTPASRVALPHLVSLIWTPGELDHVVRILEKHLWNWVQTGWLLSPAPAMAAVISAADVLDSISPMSENLSKCLFVRLGDNAQGRRKSYDTVQFLAKVSPRAVLVIDDVIEPSE